MTPDTLPPLTSQAALHETWEALMGSYGFSRQSLWMFVIGPDDRAVPAITEIGDLPPHPRPHDHDRLTRALVGAVPSGHRAAFLVSRPGRDGLSTSDRRWAAALVAACREAGVTHAAVHRANDAGILPVTLDDLPSGARRVRPA